MTAVINNVMWSPIVLSFLWTALFVNSCLSISSDRAYPDVHLQISPEETMANGDSSLERREHDLINAGMMLRHSALQHRNPSQQEISELTDQTNVNASQSLSNTSITDLEADNMTQVMQARYRERRKQERLMAIQSQILQRLRISRQPNASPNVFSAEDQRRLDALVQRVHDINNNNNNNHNSRITEVTTHENGHHRVIAPDSPRTGDSSESVTTDASIPTPFRLHTTIQWLQSFYPSCSLHYNIDEEVWDLPGTFRIYYDLPLSKYLVGPEITVLLAKLRLYKITDSANIQQDNRYDDTAESTINVSIYQLMRPLRINKKERKRLVDTQTISLGKEGWIEFNIVSTLNYWIHHTHRNFGFDIQAEDNQGNKLNPNLLFRNLNCSSADTVTQDPPFPNLKEIHPEMENETSFLDNETYPTLDLQTADLTKTYDSNSFRHIMRPSSTSAPSSTPSTTINNVSGEERTRRSDGGPERTRRNNKGRKGTSRNNGEQERVLNKRHIPSHNSSPDECRNESIYITFDEISLGEVVIAPKGFHWTICGGSCHAMVDSKIEKTKSGIPFYPEPFVRPMSSLWKSFTKNQKKRKSNICVASGWTSLPVLHIDKNNFIQFTVLENFAPSSCSCGTS